ncbi:MAG TPA: alginate export family protein [Bryobacteraceae bacterium]|nr:alginate export family protein [Bryobacteraceae bacterium]
MKRRFPYTTSLAFFAALSIPIALSGQNQTPSDKTSSTGSALQGQAQNDPADDDQTSRSGAMNYLLRTVRFTGSIRERWEETDGPFSVTPADSYVLSQERLGLSFQPSSWLHFVVEAQDARVLFYKTTPSSAISNPIDLHYAWVSLGNSEGPGTFVQVGRQNLVIGSGHLIASLDDWWGNTARDFDVVNGSYTTKFFKTQLVAGSEVLINPDAPDEHKPGDHFYVDYNTFGHLVPGASLEPYFIARTYDGVKSKEGQAGNAETLALGGRWIGKLPGSFDYNFEPMHEYGYYSSDQLDANALLAGAGWTSTPFGWKTRVSTDYEYASGDNEKKNGTRETFDNMFGFNQPMNSLTGAFGFKNLKDLRSGVEFTPVKKLKIKVDGREFWLANTADGLYNALGTLTVHNMKATSAHVGESIEMMATATLTKNTAFGFGVGTLFPGEYLKQSGKDQAYLYPYISFIQKF